MCVLTVVVFGLMLTGCPQQTADGGLEPPDIDAEAALAGEAAESAEVAAPEGDPIKIGAIFATTGPAAALGQPEADTAEMVEKMVNDAGGIDGRPLEIIIRDTKGEETEALAAIKELIEKEGVLAIVGPTRSGTTLGIIDAIEKAEVPLVSCAAASKITTPVKKWVFKTPQTDAHAVEAIYGYLNDQGISKIAVITASSGFGVAGLEQLKSQAEAAGIEIVTAEEFQDSDTDMTAQLTRIKNGDAQGVICWGIGPPPSLITKQMAQIQLDIPIFQSHGVANKRFIEGAGDAAEGVILPAGKLLVVDQLPDSEPQKAVLAAYKKAYEEAFEKDVDTFGGHAWDALQMIINGIREGGDDRAAIRDAIESTTGFVGTGGVFNYSADDHYGLTADAFVMIKIVDGEWQLAD